MTELPHRDAIDLEQIDGLKAPAEIVEHEMAAKSRTRRAVELLVSLGVTVAIFAFAIPAIVPGSNSSVAGTSTPNASAAWFEIRAAFSESPPSSTKASSTPTCSRPRTWLQIDARAASTAVAGAFDGASTSRRSRPGCGRRRRSVLPFGVCGIAASATNADGSM